MIKEYFLKNKISWEKSLISGFYVDENNLEIPWMTYEIIEFLKNKIDKNHEVFEFGCGSSTLFYARNAKNVTSIETNKFWKNLISKKLAENNLVNHDIFLMENAMENNNYQIFPQTLKKKFDVIIIDSLKRFECATNAIKSLKENGLIILDDSERQHYKKIFDFFINNGFTKQDFVGIAPAQLKLKNSTIFFRN
jgi:tRNA A58 N-methylase Trm61